MHTILRKKCGVQKRPLTVNWRDVITTFLLPVIVLALVAITGLVIGSDSIRFLMRDLSATANVHPATGAVSSLGAFFWFGTAAVLLFSIFISRQRAAKKAYNFILFAAFLTLYLWMDDFYLIHEVLAPGLGIRERYVMLILLATFGIYVSTFWRLILNYQWPWLLASLGFLGTSVLSDGLFSHLIVRQNGWFLFIEDGLKLLGITCWARFHLHVVYSVFNQNLIRMQLPVEGVISESAADHCASNVQTLKKRRPEVAP